MSHSLSSSETNSSLKASSNTTVGEAASDGLSANDGTTTAPFAISLVQECSATKKGVLWEQQQNRFFFNRWKERFFILTTDYLTCFKKGSKKVGMSEMGSFVYKINLNEVKALTWVDKKKSGVIGVQLANTAIFLWNDSERLLDDWMVSLQESTNRTKVRREQMRKSATLLPSLLTSSPSRLSSKEINLIERNNSPNLFLQHGRSNTPSDQDLMTDIGPPPPPPPRRYMRCFSTDLDNKIATLGDKKMMTSSPRNRAPPVPPHNHSQNHNNTFHKLGIGNFEGHKLSTSSNHSFGPVVSQSLRCKSSVLLLSNSPTLLAQHQQRRATAKRLSTISGFASGHPPRPQSQTVFPVAMAAASSGDRADSDFTFIPTKSISIKSNLDTYRHFNSTSTTPKNSHLLPQQGPHRNMLTSSASLVLNSRRKLQQHQSWAELERKALATPPPPVPPHRTHLHHF